MFEHEKLIVYHKAVASALELRRIALKLPPHAGDLRDQLRRAAASIVLNLAEGANEYSPGDKSRLYRISRRSAAECAAVLDLLGPFATDECARAKLALNEVVALLTRLINAQPIER